jgi:hypothetical protein
VAFYDLYWAGLRAAGITAFVSVYARAGRILGGDDYDCLLTDLARRLGASLVAARPYGIGEHFCCELYFGVCDRLCRPICFGASSAADCFLGTTRITITGTPSAPDFSLSIVDVREWPYPGMVCRSQPQVYRSNAVSLILDAMTFCKLPKQKLSQR